MEKWEEKERLDLLTFILIDEGKNHKIKTIDNENLANFTIKEVVKESGFRYLNVDFDDAIYHLTYAHLEYISAKWKFILQLKDLNL